MSLYDEKNIIRTDGDIIEDAAKELKADGVTIKNGVQKTAENEADSFAAKADEAADAVKDSSDDAAAAASEETEKAGAAAEEAGQAAEDAAAEASGEAEDADAEIPAVKKEELPGEDKKEKKKKEKKPEPPADKKALKNGSYFMGITVIVLAAIVIINMIVGAIPSNFTKIDITNNKLYSIGNTTKGVLSNLNQDVTIYYLAQSGSEDDTLSRLLDSYKAASSHISVVEKDLNTSPTFAKQYTDKTVSQNSLIVVCGDKSRYIDNSSIYPSSSSYYSQSTTFDGEGQITSAIANVTSTTEVKAYYTTGHSEISLGSQFEDTLSKANVSETELNLLNSDIPDDCNVLIIFSPTADFTTEESQKVITYLQNGGHAMIVSLATKTEMPNFDSILSTFGVSHESGYVIDNNSANYTQSPVLLMPTKDSSSPVYDGLSDLNLVYPFAQAITTASDATYTVTPILESSDQSYSISMDTTTGTQADGDPQGPFDLAVSITGGDKGTKILYYTTPCAFSSDALSSLLQSSVSLPEGNTKLLSNSITYLTDAEQSITVESKTEDVPYNTVAENVGMITRSIFMYILPAAILIFGFAIWLKRRKH